MNRVDGVILGVGIVVLAASIVGVIMYDEESPQTFQVTWSQSEALELDEQTDSGAPGEFTFETNISEETVARAEFEVAVTSSGAQVADDDVEVQVEAPGGGTESCTFTVSAGQTSSSGGCTAEFDAVNPRPDVQTVNAVNNTDAREQAVDEAAFDNGTGMWTTTVTIDGGDELDDPDYDVSLTPTIYNWRATASQPGAGGRAG